MRLTLVLAPTLALALTLAPLPARAACPGQTFLDCPVRGGKAQLQVCIARESFTYAYGPRGKPDLQLSVPMSEGTVTPWSGVGRAIWSAVTFSNQGHLYEAWSSVDRDPEAPAPTGGVNVLKDGELLAQIECDRGTVGTPAFLLEDAMAAAGYCWNFGEHRWQRGGCG